MRRALPATGGCRNVFGSVPCVDTARILHRSKRFCQVSTKPRRGAACDLVVRVQVCEPCRRTASNIAAMSQVECQELTELHGHEMVPGGSRGALWHPRTVCQSRICLRWTTGLDTIAHVRTWRSVRKPAQD